MIEHVNEAVKILKSRLKDAGIKGVDIQYYLANGDAEYLILVFPNDVNENGTPYYNKDIDSREYSVRINSLKSISNEEALKYITTRIKNEEDFIWDDALSFCDDEPLYDVSFDKYFEQMMEILTTA